MESNVVTLKLRGPWVQCTDGASEAWAGKGHAEDKSVATRYVVEPGELSSVLDWFSLQFPVLCPITARGLFFRDSVAWRGLPAASFP